jgi:hypothetical protein
MQYTTYFADLLDTSRNHLFRDDLRIHRRHTVLSAFWKSLLLDITPRFISQFFGKLAFQSFSSIRYTTHVLSLQEKLDCYNLKMSRHVDARERVLNLLKTLNIGESNSANKVRLTNFRQNHILQHFRVLGC